MSDEFRLPNRILTPEERGRAQRLKGLDENNLPLGLTDEEKQAAEAITPKENFMPDTAPTEALLSEGSGQKPLISKTLLGLAAVALPFLYGAVAILPTPLGPIAQALLYVAGGLLGVGLAVPKVLAGRALVAVPALGTLSASVGGYAATMPEGTLKAALIAASVILAVLTGVALDAPKR